MCHKLIINLHIMKTLTYICVCVLSLLKCFYSGHSLQATLTFPFLNVNDICWSVIDKGGHKRVYSDMLKIF